MESFSIEEEQFLEAVTRGRVDWIAFRDAAEVDYGRGH